MKLNADYQRGVERLHHICAATTTSGKFARVIFILLSLQNQIRNRNRLE